MLQELHDAVHVAGVQDVLGQVRGRAARGQVVFTQSLICKIYLHYLPLRCLSVMNLTLLFILAGIPVGALFLNFSAVNDSVSCSFVFYSNIHIKKL